MAKQSRSTSDTQLPIGKRVWRKTRPVLRWRKHEARYTNRRMLSKRCSKKEWSHFKQLEIWIRHQTLNFNQWSRTTSSFTPTSEHLKYLSSCSRPSNKVNSWCQIEQGLTPLSLLQPYTKSQTSTRWWRIKSRYQRTWVKRENQSRTTSIWWRGGRAKIEEAALLLIHFLRAQWTCDHIASRHFR